MTNTVHDARLQAVVHRSGRNTLHQAIRVVNDVGEGEGGEHGFTLLAEISDGDGISARRDTDNWARRESHSNGDLGHHARVDRPRLEEAAPAPLHGNRMILL
eukprot:scaffold21265_cov131-Isochrysis_galbana.AAC.4